MYTTFNALGPFYYRTLGRLCYILFICLFCYVIEGEVVCECPNNVVGQFHGALLWSGQSFSLDIGHLLLRGCTLRNTGWCYGLVVFAGRDSKLLMNDTAPQSFIKQGHLDRVIDQLVVWVIPGLLWVWEFPRAGIPVSVGTEMNSDGSVWFIIP